MTYDFQWSSVTYTFRWMSIADSHTCPKCMALNGQEIIGDPFSSTLIHPEFGPIWDFETDQPLTHGHSPHNCRCMIEPRAIVNFGELKIESVEVNFPMGTTLADLREQLTGLNANVIELNSALRTYMALARRVGLPENIMQAGVSMQQAVIATNVLARGVSKLQAGGLTGILTGVGSIALGGVMGIDIMLQLQQYGQENWKNISEGIARERQQALELQQMEIRRRRY